MTTCAPCSRTWTGLTEAHCAACHLHFSSPSAFDVHRVTIGEDSRGCADPTTQTTKAGHPPLMSVERKSGPVWVPWRDPDAAMPEHWQSGS